jgi:galactonate dehydratase
MTTIADYEILHVPPRWLFVRLETSDGEVGWGECVTGIGPKNVASAVETLAEARLVGEDPSPVEDHWQTMYRGGFYRGGPVHMAAIAGLDQALWDLRGRAFDAPAYELLGGPVRNRIRVYGWIGGDRPAEVGEAARERVEAGLTAVKMNATPEFRRVETPAAVQAAVDRLAEVRSAVGDEVGIGVDFHGRVSKPMAKRLASALEPYEPMFLEEAVLPEHLDALGEVAQHTTVPIATGERLYSRFEFKRLFEQGVVDVIQPDVSHAGGITEVTKIASMAEAYDVALAPHCPLGPVALAACLQVDAVAANALIQEQSLGIHYNRDADLLDYLVDPTVFAYEDGYVDLPEGPGLGVELDEEAVRAAAVDEPDWGESLYLQRPTWRHDDGGVAEW